MGNIFAIRWKLKLLSRFLRQIGYVKLLKTRTIDQERDHFNIYEKMIEDDLQSLIFKI